MAVTNLVWVTSIYSNFKTLLETTLSGLTNNTLKESPSILEPLYQPASIFNGCYSIKLAGISNLETFINGQLEYDLNAQIIIAFELNQNDAAQASYNAAVNDVETVIKKRMDITTWAAGFNNVRFLGATGFQPAVSSSPETPTHQYITINFNVTGTVTL